MSDFQTNLDEFNKELEAFVADIPNQVTAIQKKIVLEALRRVVLRTPVDTGRARANWQVTIAKPATGVVSEFEDVGTGTKRAAAPGMEVGGEDVFEKGLAVIADLPPYQIVYVSNNVNYIEFLEEGSSEQAPEGMAALTVQELRQMFK